MRHNRTWIAMLAAVTALALAPTAMAGPGKGNGPPDRDDGGLEGMTCAEYYPELSTLVDGTEVNGFVLTLTESSPCIDIMNVEAGVWKVSVTLGSAREVTVALRGSIPGDWCWLENAKSDETFFFDTPKSEPNACAPPVGQGGAGGDTISDPDPELAFTVGVSRGKQLARPVVISVDFP